MDLVGEDDTAILIEAQLVLGVCQDQPPLLRHRPAAGEQSERIV